MESSEQFHIFAGSETGLLKGINLSKKSWCNVNRPSNEDRQTILKTRQIEALCWQNRTEEQLCLGLTNQTVFVYDVKSRDFMNTFQFSSGKEDDTLVSLEKYEEDYLVATQSGLVKLWTGDEEPECKLTINAGLTLDKLRQNPGEPHLIATGGKQNDLKLWNLNAPDEPIFRAKNVRHDFLNLEVPIWIMDMAFLPDSKKIVTCTGHHQIRIYDPEKQRRPVMDIEWDEYPIKSLSLRANGYHAFVGNARGEMAMVDLRGKAYIVQKYKGGAGSIRAIQCHPTDDIVASVGLDRYLRIHDINSRKLLQKFYLKSKLNCLLVSSTVDIADSVPGTMKRDKNANKPEVEEDMVVSGDDDSGDGDEDVWDKIDTVADKGAKKRKVPVETGEKKPKVKKVKKKKKKTAKQDSAGDNKNGNDSD